MRSYDSENEPNDFDNVTTKNVEWMTYPFTQMFYVASILALWGLLHMSGFLDPEDPWTVRNLKFLTNY